MLLGTNRKPFYDQRKVLVEDARPRPYDPTGTGPLRGKFRNDLDRRWAKLRQLAVSALTDHGMADPTVQSITHAMQLAQTDKVPMFTRWMEEATRQVMTNEDRFVNMYIWRAGEAADPQLPTNSRAANVMSDLACAELKGICAAVVQQATRVVANGLLANKKPARIARDVAAMIKAVGVSRGRALANFMVVKAYNCALLDMFRRQGVTHVGVMAERIRVKRGAHGLTRDADVDLSTVEVLTAGDDDVCPTCEEISNDGPYALDDAEGLIPAHLNCVLPGAIVEGQVLASLKSWYSGPAIEISTRGGKRLSVTGQHPVLTSLGPVVAQDICEGMKLLCKSEDFRGSSVGFNDYYSPPLIEEIFDALRVQGCCLVPPSSDDLHGDARLINGDVDIVAVDWRLLRYIQFQFAKRGSKLILPFTNMGHVELLRLAAVKQLLSRRFASFGSFPSSGALTSDRPATFFLDQPPFKILSFGSGSQFDTPFHETFAKYPSSYSSLIRKVFHRSSGQVTIDKLTKLSSLKNNLGSSGISKYVLEQAVNFSSRYAQFFSDLMTRQPLLIEMDDVVSVRSFNYVGHVYDLQTSVGYMIAQKILLCNCRCAFVPAEDLRFAPVRDAFDPDEPRDEHGEESDE